MTAWMALSPTSTSAQYVFDRTFLSDNVNVDDFFGTSIAEVGDVRGASVFVIGASRDIDQGRAYLIDATDGSVRSTLTSQNGTNLGEFGRAVGVVDDLTGDGIPDVVVGAPREDFSSLIGSADDAGVAYVFNGDTGDLVFELQTTGGNLESGRRFGTAVAGIGDISGDGVADIIVGAPEQAVGAAGQAGRCYLFSGADGTVIDVITGAGENGGRFGRSVAAVGDLVGDATPDFVVGAPGEDAIRAGSPANQAGRVYLFDGSTLGSTSITSGNVESGGQFGFALASVASGSTRDIIVGARSENGGANDAGRAYLVDGNDPTGTPLSLQSSLPSNQGAFGFSVNGIDDVDGDSASDILVGAPLETVGGVSNAGRAYIFSSADGSLLATLTSPSVENGRFGNAVAGSDTPLIGAPREDVGGTSQAGRVHTYIPGINFTDGRAGESYATPTLTSGTADNPVGRFLLSAGAVGPSLESVTVTNASVPAGGISSLELWTSSDDTFDPAVDSEIASSGYADDVTFSGLNLGIPFTGVYVFVVADLGSSVSGDYEPVIVDETEIDFAGGPLFSVNGSPTSTFTDAFLSTGATPLPVELAGFSAQLMNGGAVVLQWQTLSETNNSRFDLQRRETTQQAWRTIGTVEGAGTTNDPQQYRFTDSDLPYTASSMTYRLKQIDVDGGEDILSTVEVTLDAPQQVELLGTNPNPARARATARLAVPRSADAESVRLRLYDILGRQVRSFDSQVQTGQRQDVSLDLSGLASGTYLLRLSAGGSSQTQRVTVVR